MAFWNLPSLEPKRNFRYKVIFGANNAVLSPYTLFAQKFKKPSYKIETKAYDYLNHTFNFPGKLKWDESSIEFVDTILPPADATSDSNANAGAAAAATTPTTAATPKSDVITQLLTIVGKGGYRYPDGAVATNAQTAYKSLSKDLLHQQLGDITVAQLDASGDNVVEQWVLKNAFFTSIELPELAYSTDEFSTVKVTVVYDWAELDGVTLG